MPGRERSARSTSSGTRTCSGRPGSSGARMLVALAVREVEDAARDERGGAVREAPRRGGRPRAPAAGRLPGRASPPAARGSPADSASGSKSKTMRERVVGPLVSRELGRTGPRPSRRRPAVPVDCTARTLRELVERQLPALLVDPRRRPRRTPRPSGPAARRSSAWAARLNPASTPAASARP